MLLTSTFTYVLFANVLLIDLVSCNMLRYQSSKYYLPNTTHCTAWPISASDYRRILAKRRIHSTNMFSEIIQQGLTTTPSQLPHLDICLDKPHINRLVQRYVLGLSVFKYVRSSQQSSSQRYVDTLVKNMYAADEATSLISDSLD